MPIDGLTLILTEYHSMIIARIGFWVLMFGMISAIIIMISNLVSANRFEQLWKVIIFTVITIGIFIVGYQDTRPYTLYQVETDNTSSVIMMKISYDRVEQIDDNLYNVYVYGDK